MGGLNLNCDLGEQEPEAQTRELLGLVDAANISCGVHAGSPEKTVRTLALAHEAGVLIGAHPGMAGAGGRGTDLPDAEAFRELLQRQLEAFGQAAARIGAEMHHIKLHGSLYTAVERRPDLAEMYLRVLADYPEVTIFALSGGAFAEQARRCGRTICAELFADRGYLATGELVPRNQPGALIASIDEAVARVRHWQLSGELPSVSGDLLRLAGESWCVHSDSPHALELLRALRRI
jgi:UPF0271 protein